MNDEPMNLIDHDPDTLPDSHPLRSRVLKALRPHGPKNTDSARSSDESRRRARALVYRRRLVRDLVTSPVRPDISDLFDDDDDFSLSLDDFFDSLPTEPAEPCAPDDTDGLI